MLNKWNGFWKRHPLPGLMLWNSLILGPFLLAVAGMVWLHFGGWMPNDGTDYGVGDFASVILLAPLALVTLLIDLFYLLRRYWRSAR